MTKLLILIAVISTCCAGIIPNGFSANERVSDSKSEISDGKDWGNCCNEFRWSRFKSIATGRMQQDKRRDSDTKENHPNQLIKESRNSVHGIDGGELKKTEFAKSFVEYVDSNKNQRSLKGKSQNHKINELQTADTSGIFGANLESSKEIKLTDSKENHLGEQSEEFETSLQKTGNGGFDTKGVFANSFVEYADKSQKQRSFDPEKQNMHELKIADNLNEILDANFDTFVENKQTDIKENSLNKSTEEFRNSLGDEEVNKPEVFTESFIEYASSIETGESFEAELQKQNIKEFETVENNFNETTGANFNISATSLSEVIDNDSGSSEINLTDAEGSSVFDLVASVINASDVFEFLNMTDSLNFEVVTENISSVFLDVDETALMSEGSEIALFQDDSTTGFEFLIDSETTKNMILTELLRSENFVVTENGKITLLEFPDSFTEMELNEQDAEEDNEMETAVNIKPGNVQIPLEETLNLTEVLEVPTEIEMENHKTVMDISVIRTDQNVTVSKEVSDSTENLNSPTKFETELPKVTDGTNLSDGVISSTPEFPSKRCPAPGTCLFWFFARNDSCFDSSECQGSSICCKMGCSKICVVV